jgi:lysosomal acid lipase/cholesteryl ester hydrolase
MPRLPFIGRLYSAEYSALFLGLIFIIFEAIIRIITLALPRSVIQWFYTQSKELFDYLTGIPRVKVIKQDTDDTRTKEDLAELERQLRRDRALAERIRAAENFEDLCRIWGYEVEEHIVMTQDGFLLGVHRLRWKLGEKSNTSGVQEGRSKPVVYLHHGLLMNSEVWVCLTSAERSLPFVLVERGYDVWLGNNRGNKYSRKSLYLSPTSHKFWDYSLDTFSLYDIPDTITYILKATRQKSLGYVGFSQGTAQAFAALSLGINEGINDKVNVFVALSPAMRPTGLAARIVDALMKATPNLVYLFFGRKSILSSVSLWQSIMYPPIFVKVIDGALKFLFSWHCRNISPLQKLAAYAHLFSFSSVKSVVHWFQIMRSGKFLMFDDDPQTDWHGKAFYHPAKFPTRNISTPIFLLYGEEDSLVDLDVMMSELPEHTVAKGLPGYEHVDVLWGDQVDRDVIPNVLQAIQTYSISGGIENDKTQRAKQHERGLNTPPTPLQYDGEVEENVVPAGRYPHEGEYAYAGGR